MLPYGFHACLPYAFALRYAQCGLQVPLHIHVSAKVWKPGAVLLPMGTVRTFQLTQSVRLF